MSDNQYDEKRRIQLNEFVILFYDTDYCSVRFESKEVNRVEYTGTASCRLYDGEWKLELDKYGHDYDACWFRRKDAVCDRPTESANKKLKELIPALLNSLADTPEFKEAALNGGFWVRQANCETTLNAVTELEAKLAQATENHDNAKHEFRTFKREVETRAKLRIA